MNIGRHKLGEGQPIFVIAEVGSNWGSLGDCLSSIDYAASLGASAVKFQMFTQEELYGYDVGRARTHELPRHWIPILAERCLKAKVDFMCSAFSPSGVEYLTPYVSAHKVASCEASHPDIIEACRTSGKPTFVSCGALQREEFLKVLSLDWTHGVIPTYCRASYPANDAQPWRMACWQGLKCLSDHSTDLFPLAIPMYGYDAIEKHVNFVGATGPDAEHSLSRGEFSRLVAFVNNRVEVETPPTEILEFHRRRFVSLPNGTNGYFRIPK